MFAQNQTETYYSAANAKGTHDKARKQFKQHHEPEQGTKGYADCIESIGAEHVSVNFYSSDRRSDGQEVTIQDQPLHVLSVTKQSRYR